MNTEDFFTLIDLFELQTEDGRKRTFAGMRTSVVKIEQPQEQRERTAKKPPSVRRRYRKRETTRAKRRGRRRRR